MEQILVIPTSIFRSVGYFQGFSRGAKESLPMLLGKDHLSFRPRDQMESDPSFKQLIPYVLLCHEDPNLGMTVFEYTRGKGQGEQRLHRKRSIGIGGHISDIDAQTAEGSDWYRQGMERELQEEVVLDSPFASECVGMINDDESDVGRVHLGIVHLLKLESPRVHPRESDILDCGFRPVAQLLSDLEGFETWSQLCLKGLFSRE